MTATIDRHHGEFAAGPKRLKRVPLARDHFSSGRGTLRPRRLKTHWPTALMAPLRILLMSLTAAALPAAEQIAARSPAPPASVEWLTGAPSAVWADGARELDVVVRNRTGQSLALPVTFQLLQANSATAAAWSSPVPWRTVALAPDQASLERAVVQFPAVRGPVTFLVRFTHGRDVLGVVPVRVYPDRILRDLTNRLGPVLVEGLPAETMSVLSAAGWTLAPVGQLVPSDRGLHLAFLGPTCPPARARALAQAGLGVIWLRPGSQEVQRAMDTQAMAPIEPSYRTVRIGKSVVVVVQSGTLAGLVRDPDAQRRLARMTQLALGLEWETLGPASAEADHVEAPAWKERN